MLTAEELEVAAVAAEKYPRGCARRWVSGKELMPDAVEHALTNGTASFDDC